MDQSEKGIKYRAVFREISWYRDNVPCMTACPVHTDSGRYVQKIAECNDLDAFLIARSPNPLASICGRVCAAPCEDACRRSWIDEAVTIRPLKRFVTERMGAESSVPDTYKGLLNGDAYSGCRRSWHMSQLNSTRKVSGQKIAVIGSGPSGLACAHDLALMGYKVTIFEALPLAGGMLRYGIPEYRLPRGVIDREIAIVEECGVEIKTGYSLSEERGLQHLRNEGYEAFFLGVGAMKGRDLTIPGSDKDGVIKAVDYLLNLNRGYRVDLGEKVVVIGGGSVALDAARTAVREFYKPMEEIEWTAEAAAVQPAIDAARGALRAGAKEVHVASLEPMDILPAAKTVQGREELESALDEGIKLHTAWGPRAIVGDSRVTGIELVACTRVFDENGRFNPLFDESKTFHIDTESVILAIGQQPNLDFLSPSDKVELTPSGTIKIDPDTLATTADGIFAGGDAAFGPRIAIEAVANGKRAAQSIDQFLTKTKPTISLSVNIQNMPVSDYSMPEQYEKRLREQAPTVPIDRRTGIAEVENVFDENNARIQAERCLNCHVDTIYDPLKCVLCGRCADVCPEKCLVFIPLSEAEIPEDQVRQAMQNYGHDNEKPLTVLLKDDTNCIRCGLCAKRCPTDAMTMERFNFVENVE